MQKTILLLIVVLLVTVSCQPSPTRTLPPTPVSSTSIPPAATLIPPTPAEESYELVDPAELECALNGLSVRSIVGQPEGTEGEVQELICEGTSIELASTTLSGGFLETTQYGKIKIEMSNSVSSAGFSLWLTPTQKAAIIKAVKPTP